MYVEFDEDTGYWCIFNDNGKAVSSWSTKEQAEYWLENNS